MTRITKADLSTLAGLVEKYSGETIARTALRLASPPTPQKKRGRRPLTDNEVTTWWAVEVRRRAVEVLRELGQTSEKKMSVEKACRDLMRKIKQTSLPPHPHWTTLQGQYYRADQRRRADPKLHALLESEVAHSLNRWEIPLPLLYRWDGDQLKSPVIDSVALFALKAKNPL